MPKRGDGGAYGMLAVSLILEAELVERDHFLGIVEDPPPPPARVTVLHLPNGAGPLAVSGCVWHYPFCRLHTHLVAPAPQHRPIRLAMVWDGGRYRT